MDLNQLVQAIQTLNAEDAFRARLSMDQWRTIAPYLSRHDIRQGDLLVKQVVIACAVYVTEDSNGSRT